MTTYTLSTFNNFQIRNSFNTFEDWEEITIKIKRKKNICKPSFPILPYENYTTTINGSEQKCAIEEFFKNHPNERACWLVCTCPKHSIWI